MYHFRPNSGDSSHAIEERRSHGRVIARSFDQELGVSAHSHHHVPRGYSQTLHFHHSVLTEEGGNHPIARQVRYSIKFFADDLLNLLALQSSDDQISLIEGERQIST